MKKTTTKAKKTKDNFVLTVGRRRTAIARVKMYPNKVGGITVNGKPIEEYFSGEVAKNIYQEPLRTCNLIGKCLIEIVVSGSGKVGQLGAVVHGISRALVLADESRHKVIKSRGFLTRDPRTRERRKVGMGGKARRKKQSPKR